MYFRQAFYFKYVNWFTGKLVISVEVDLGEKIGNDGLQRWTIKDWKHSYELKDKATIELENLFNGNAILGSYLTSFTY